MKKKKLYPFFYGIILFALGTNFTNAVNGQTITTIAGNDSSGYSGDGGAATAAKLYEPWGVAIDRSGNVYIGDAFNNRIRKVSTSGVISTIAGTGTSGFSGDGGPATAANLKVPFGICLDTAGNIYFSDNNNNRLRKINPLGIITTIAGNGTYGFSGDSSIATSAEINGPEGVAADRFGNVYFSDAGNHRIRKINASGIISTICGTGTSGYSGDGAAATAAQIDFPSGLVVDNSRNIYFSDFNENCVRKINSSGIITTIAGTGTSGFSGDGGAATAATLNNPVGVDVDNCGDVYISDMRNNRIRMISTTGTITTVAGTGTVGYNGDGGPATAADINKPHAICHDATGNIFFADRINYTIRKVGVLFSCTTGITETSSLTAIALSASPNPNNGNFKINLSSPVSEIAQFSICNMLGETIKEMAIETNRDVEIQLHIPAGIYTISSIMKNERIISKIVIQ